MAARARRPGGIQAGWADFGRRQEPAACSSGGLRHTHQDLEAAGEARSCEILESPMEAQASGHAPRALRPPSGPTRSSALTQQTGMKRDGRSAFRLSAKMLPGVVDHLHARQARADPGEAGRMVCRRCAGAFSRKGPCERYTKGMYTSYC